MFLSILSILFLFSSNVHLLTARRSIYIYLFAGTFARGRLVALSEGEKRRDMGLRGEKENGEKKDDESGSWTAAVLRPNAEKVCSPIRWRR